MSTSGSPARYAHADLHRLVVDVLTSLDVEIADAARSASFLLDSDLAGVDTHGIAQVAGHPHYAPGLRDGSIAARPEIEVLRDAPVASAWDAHGGFGPIVARRAMDTAIAKAEANGVGMVSVRDARHYGANGVLVESAAERGLIGLALSDTPAAAFPPGGRRKAIGTNPFGFAAPIDDGPPLVIDVSATAAAGSKVINARRRGEVVPVGWVVDADGRATTDPEASRTGGALDLLGGDVARHKGYALGLIVQTIAMLSGNGPSALIRPGQPWSQGQWFAAWRIDLFAEPERFAADMTDLAAMLHDAGDQPGEVRLPGERRAACRRERSTNGIPVADDVVAGLQALASDREVPFPDPIRRARRSPRSTDLNAALDRPNLEPPDDPSHESSRPGDPARDPR